MSIIHRSDGERYAEECIKQQKHKIKNGECEKHINECVRKSHKCLNYDDSEKITKCYGDAINWADKHCNSHPSHTHPSHTHPSHRHPSHTHPSHRHPSHTHPSHTHPSHTHPNHRQPDHRQRYLRGETYAQECIQQAKSSGRNYSEEDVMKCLSHKCFNLDYDSDTIQKCGDDGINFIQNNYENSHRDHRYPDHRQPDHRQPDHRQPDHTQVRAERYGQECIEQDKSSSRGSLENALKCVRHKCFNLDYDGDTIQKCSLYGVKYVQNNYDNSEFYGIY